MSAATPIVLQNPAAFCSWSGFDIGQLVAFSAETI
jgi:hypothetical protein